MTYHDGNSINKVIKKIKKSFKKSKSFDDLHKINIAYVLKGFPTLSQTFVLNELKWLVKNNYNVTVFCYIDPMEPIELDFDLEVVRFDKKDNPMENLENLLKEYKIDLIHTHFVYPPCTEYTLDVAEKLEIPFTVFAHAVDIFKKDVDKINRVKEIGNSKYCKAIFTLSQYHKNYLLKRGVPEGKIVITKQATDYKINELKPRTGRIRKIISISRFVDKKGIDIFIDAAKILEDEDFEFEIYGSGALEKDLQNQIDELNLKNIEIKGRLDGPKEVEKVFNKSDVLVSPCRISENGDRDGIPTVIFESMAYGVTVLTTNVSAIPEVINDGKNGFIVPPDNPEALADKIRYISNLNNEEIFKINKQAQKDVINTSSVEKTMNTLLKTWKEK